VPAIARRGTPHGTGLGIYRWVIERSFASEFTGLVDHLKSQMGWPAGGQCGSLARGLLHDQCGSLAAIVFVATSGCTWQQLLSASFGPPSGATAHRHFSEWAKARV